QEFKDTGQDGTKCARAALIPRFAPGDDGKSLEEWLTAFNNTGECRRKCTIDEFLLARRRGDWTKVAGLANEETASISAEAKRVLERGADACTCTSCGKYGDAVVALLPPPGMQLEHTDGSFNVLCPALGVPHRQLQSQAAFHAALRS